MSTTMTEAECLKAIDDGANAFDLLDKMAPGCRQEFNKVDRALLRLLARVRKTFPDAEFYTASGGFNLLLGKPHTSDNRQRGQQQLIAASGNAAIGDGDF